MAENTLEAVVLVACIEGVSISSFDDLMTAMDMSGTFRSQVPGFARRSTTR
jgi:hypothetical protein